MSLPWVTCGVILLWELQCCCCCLRCCWRRRRFRVRPRPTQVFYQAFFGVQGKYYAFKVAALQCITVLIQTFAKASVFHDFIETLGAVALRGHISVYAFLALLFCNIAFPAFMFCFPNRVFSRVGAAVMDAVLDMGYLITSLALYMDLARFEVIFLQNFWDLHVYVRVRCTCAVRVSIPGNCRLGCAFSGPSRSTHLGSVEAYSFRYGVRMWIICSGGHAAWRQRPGEPFGGRALPTLRVFHRVARISCFETLHLFGYGRIVSHHRYHRS